MTPQRVAAAARLVKKGAIFPLDVPFGTISPALSKLRGTPRHCVLHEEGSTRFDDVYDNFYPQASSQWDSLGHIGYAPDRFYNGARAEDVLSGRRNTIEHWSRHGIAGRALMLDMPKAMREAGRHYHPGESIALGVEELELGRRAAGVELAPGDTILLHTGFAAWYLDQGRDTRERLQVNASVPGIAHTEEVCEYLWNSHVSAVASDNYAVEVWPPERSVPGSPMGFLHRMLIGQLGMALGELWWLADLASDCATDGVYEAFLVSAPFNAPGGIGSCANAVALK
jgi:kynurenine formamidase